MRSTTLVGQPYTMEVSHLTLGVYLTVLHHTILCVGRKVCCIALPARTLL